MTDPEDAREYPADCPYLTKLGEFDELLGDYEFGELGEHMSKQGRLASMRRVLVERSAWELATLWRWHALSRPRVRMVKRVSEL